MNKFNILLLPFALILIFTSCKKEEEQEPIADLVGNWELIEMLADPGDGSGVFEPVVSDRQLSFFADGNLDCVGNLCEFSFFSSGPITTGKYSISTTLITDMSCDENYQIAFEVTSDTLILRYPCIEPCQAKYLKLK